MGPCKEPEATARPRIANDPLLYAGPQHTQSHPGEPQRQTQRPLCLRSSRLLQIRTHHPMVAPLQTLLPNRQCWHDIPLLPTFILKQYSSDEQRWPCMHAGLKSLARKMSARGRTIGGLLGSFTRTFSGDDSSRDSPRAARQLGGLFGSFTRTFSGDNSPKDSPKSPRRHSLNGHQTGAAALQKESSLERTGRKEAVRHERASNPGPGLHCSSIPPSTE